MADCGMFEWDCKSKEFLASAIGDQLTKTADAVLELVGKAIASLGTMWVNVGTPILTGGGGSSGVTPGDSAANSSGVDTVLGYAMWIALGVCVLSLMVAGARMTLPSRHGGHQHSERIGTVLISAILISGAVSLATAIAPAARSNGSPAVAFIQDSLWWYTIAFAAFGIIVGAARMAWEQRSDLGKDLVKSLITLAVVTGAGLTTITLLVTAGDSFSVWLINGSLDCNITDTNGTCFGGNMADLLALTTKTPATAGLGAIGIILFGLLAVFGSAVQVVLMVVRSGMLVLLVGMLPITAAATNTSVGQNMFRKTLGWLLAAILYKPAAAIVYATAFKLAGTNVFKDDGSGFTSVVVGLTMIVLALLALPALMKLIIPAVSSVSSGGGMAAGALAGAAMLPSGAAAAGRLLGKGGGGGGGSTSAPSGSGPSGSPGQSGSSGNTGSSGTGTPGGSGPSGTSAGNAGSGPGAGGSTAAGGAGGSTAGAGNAGAAAAGGGAAAAAGPVAAAAGSAAQVAGKAKAAAQNAANTSSGEGGPNGSN